jgi:hypothetical protein
MTDERDTTDPPHREATDDLGDEQVPLDLEDAPLADPERPEAAPNDMPETA